MKCGCYVIPKACFGYKSNYFTYIILIYLLFKLLFCDLSSNIKNISKLYFEVIFLINGTTSAISYDTSGQIMCESAPYFHMLRRVAGSNLAGDDFY